MRDSVRDAFMAYTVPLEGVAPFLYCDAIGLVTIAIGVLVDPLPHALTLPLKVPADGWRDASRDEIAADWHRVKDRQDIRHKGGMVYGQIARLRLTEDGVRDVTLRKLANMEDRLRLRFDQWDEWPADAQMAVLSLTWACGPAFRFPKLSAYLRAQDWARAATECDIRPDHGTIKKRNAAQRLCLRNAAAVYDNMGDPERLWWPRECPDGVKTDPASPQGFDRAGGGMLAIEGVAEGALAARREPNDPSGDL